MPEPNLTSNKIGTGPEVPTPVVLGILPPFLWRHRARRGTEENVTLKAFYSRKMCQRVCHTSPADPLGIPERHVQWVCLRF